MTGWGVRGGLPLEGRGWPATLLLAPAWPIILRHPDESQDPEPWSAVLVTLDPDFRQDDGVVGGVAACRLRAVGGRRRYFWRLPGQVSSVILTKVRIQSHGVRRS